MRGSDVHARDLPAGEVCFLFTDVAGSTAILRTVGDAEWGRLQGEMHAIVRYAIESHGGTVVNTEGDGCFAAFPTAAAGAQACAAAQRVLGRIRWGGDNPVFVRMGLHVGFGIQPVDDDYVALAVHQTARVCSAAHGGQVLATAAVVQRCAPDEQFTDLGLFSVRDFDGPVRLFGLDRPGAAPRRPNAPHAFDSELPRYRTALVAREREIANVIGQLRAPTLLTLTGPAGVGKTRLAVAVLAQLLETAPVGPWFVDVTMAEDTAGVWDLIARALGCASSDVDVRLDALLDDREAVMVLDNCAHVAAPVAATVQLLTDWNPTLQLLATSREPLGVPGELAWPVPPLDEPRQRDLAAVLESGAGRLFAERLGQVGEVELTAATAAAAHDICAAVDGLPLAVELAAGLCATNEPTDVAAELAGLASAGLSVVVQRCLADLPQTERQALAALALAGQPIGHRLAAAALKGAGLADDRVEQVLASLVRRALLGPVPEFGYRVADPVGVAARDSLGEESRRTVLEALLGECLAVTADDPVPLSRHEQVAETASALVRDSALPIRDRQRLAAQLGQWWTGRLGARRARELLTAALVVGRAGSATAALHLAIAATYEPGQETVQTEHHVREAGRLLGEQDRVDPAAIARIQAGTMRELREPTDRSGPTS